jgi:putative acetyltransferase
MSFTHIRRMRPEDSAPLHSLWERSVRATHHFLGEADIEFYRPLVADIRAKGALDLWVLTDHENAPIGFLGLAANRIEALFLEPACRRQGYGRLLVAHAQDRLRGALAVDVNEENAAAREFYEALGFVVVGRSPLDDSGRPHPLLHMCREAPRTDPGT